MVEKEIVYHVNLISDRNLDGVVEMSLTSQSKFKPGPNNRSTPMDNTYTGMYDKDDLQIRIVSGSIMKREGLEYHYHASFSGELMENIANAFERTLVSAGGRPVSTREAGK